MGPRKLFILVEKSSLKIQVFEKFRCEGAGSKMGFNQQNKNKSYSSKEMTRCDHNYL